MQNQIDLSFLLTSFLAQSRFQIFTGRSSIPHDRPPSAHPPPYTPSPSLKNCLPALIKYPPSFVAAALLSIAAGRKDTRHELQTARRALPEALRTWRALRRPDPRPTLPRERPGDAAVRRRRPQNGLSRDGRRRGIGRPHAPKRLCGRRPPQNRRELFPTAAIRQQSLTLSDKRPSRFRPLRASLRSENEGGRRDVPSPRLRNRQVAPREQGSVRPISRLSTARNGPHRQKGKDPEDRFRRASGRSDRPRERTTSRPRAAGLREDRNSDRARAAGARLGRCARRHALPHLHKPRGPRHAGANRRKLS